MSADMPASSLIDESDTVVCGMVRSTRINHDCGLWQTAEQVLFGFSGVQRCDSLWMNERLSEGMNTTSTQPAVQSHGVRTRWCSRGDTISTVRPMSEYAGPFSGCHPSAICDTPESCAEANSLIAAGRWRVSRCGRCGKPVESCRCDSANAQFNRASGRPDSSRGSPTEIEAWQ